MKRSSQVALVLMGVTATTAAGAYMLPSRPECRQAAPSTVVNPPTVLPGAQAAAQEPCRRRRWGGWSWGPVSYSSNRSRPAYSTRAPTSVSTALRPSSGASGRSTSSPSATTTSSSRGGFGSTGRSMSSRSGGGS